MYIQRIYFDRIIAPLTFEHWIKFKSRANKNSFIKILKTDYIYKSVSAYYCSFLNIKLQFLLQLFWHCFCFGSVSSFFLELFLHTSPVAYWASTDLGSSSFSVISFCLFILFTGFSRQEYWSCLPFPSPVDRILSELSTMIHPSWVAHSFSELDKAVVHVIRLFSFLWLWFSFCLPSDGWG